jgi:hypothetical protein
MPDFFRGKPCTEEMLGDRERLMAWIGKFGSFEVVRTLAFNPATCGRKCLLTFFPTDLS